jgi:hypothetical protein
MGQKLLKNTSIYLNLRSGTKYGVCDELGLL